MTSRIQNLPVGVDRQLFDGLQYNDLIRTILEFPKYHSRETRRLLGLEDYMRNRVIDDFIGINLYGDLMIGMSRINLLPRYGDNIDTNYKILQFLLLLINDNANNKYQYNFSIDPFILYAYLSNIYQELYNVRNNVDIPFLLHHQNSSFFIKPLVITLTRIGMTEKEIENIIAAFISTIENDQYYDDYVVSSIFDAGTLSKFTSNQNYVINIYLNLVEILLEGDSVRGVSRLIKKIQEEEDSEIYNRFMFKVNDLPSFREWFPHIIEHLIAISSGK